MCEQEYRDTVKMVGIIVLVTALVVGVLSLVPGYVPSDAPCLAWESETTLVPWMVGETSILMPVQRSRCICRAPEYCGGGE